jgi:NAD(P)-dependent dehydrogenase (short-subunit alcohol dehydrogenase family)
MFVPLFPILEVSLMSKLFILVTGATAGIGRAAAIALAKEGHHVIGAGRRVDALEELKREANVDVVRLDVTDPASVDAAMKEIERITGGHGLDVLINNAGYGLPGALTEIGDAELRAQYETNVFGLMRVTRAAVPAMIKRRSGRIINVSSIGGRMTFPFFGAYNSTKYAIESLSDALRVELGAFGIEVALVEPGPIKTEFSAVSLTNVNSVGKSDSPFAAVYARAGAIAAESDRMAGKPEDVVRAILHAVTARRPRVRYVVPRAASFALSLLRLLPTRILDAILARFVGLTRRSAPAPQLPATT